MTAKRFHDNMVGYLDEYQEYLLLVKSNATAVSNCSIIHEFINYIFNHHLVSAIDLITVSIANSKFHDHYKKQNREVISKDEMKKILKEFFVFLHGKYWIKNDKLMKGFAFK